MGCGSTLEWRDGCKEKDLRQTRGNKFCGRTVLHNTLLLHAAFFTPPKALDIQEVKLQVMPTTSSRLT